MKKNFLLIFLLAFTIFSYPRRADAIFWFYSSAGVKGTVVDADSEKPLEGVTVCYDIYRGTGKIYRNSYQLFQHVTAKTDGNGRYRLPGLFRPYWLVRPGLCLFNCFIPGLGVHDGFSVTKVTIYKSGFNNLVLDLEELRLRPSRKLKPAD